MKPGATLHIHVGREQSTVEAGQLLKGYVILEVHRYFVHGTSVKVSLKGCENAHVEYLTPSRGGNKNSESAFTCNASDDSFCFFQEDYDCAIPHSHQKQSSDADIPLDLDLKKHQKMKKKPKKSEENMDDRIMKGRYQIPFEFAFPEDLPGSQRIDFKRRLNRHMLEDFGRIKYEVQAVLQGSETDWRDSYKASAEVLVKSKQPSYNSDDADQKPLKKAFDSGFIQAKVMKHHCLPCGDIVGRVLCPETHLMPGQKAQVSIVCRNNSLVNIASITVKLMEHVQWKAKKQTYKFSQQLGGYEVGQDEILHSLGLQSKRQRRRSGRAMRKRQQQEEQQNGGASSSVSSSFMADEPAAFFSSGAAAAAGSDETSSVAAGGKYDHGYDTDDSYDGQDNVRILEGSVLIPRARSHSSYLGEIMTIRHQLEVTIAMNFCSPIIEHIPITILDVDFVRRSLLTNQHLESASRNILNVGAAARDEEEHDDAKEKRSSHHHHHHHHEKEKAPPKYLPAHKRELGNSDSTDETKLSSSSSSSPNHDRRHHNNHQQHDDNHHSHHHQKDQQQEQQMKEIPQMSWRTARQKIVKQH